MRIPDVARWSIAVVAGLVLAASSVAQDELSPGVPVPPVQPAFEDIPGDVDPSAAVTNAPAADGKESAYEQIRLLAEIMMHVRRSYVDSKSYAEIMAGALHGMLQTLDPHSDFMEADAFQEMQEDTKGRFSGIGIHIGMREGALTVIAPIEDTPAFRAGVLGGDRILEIDGQKTQGLSMNDAVKNLRGIKGSTVRVKLLRAGQEPFEVAIVRDDIEVASVKGARIVRDAVGYVRVTQFAIPTADNLQTALDDLRRQGAKALVIDLRNNPGGLLRSAVQIASKFLKEGQVIVTTRGRDGLKDATVSRAEGPVHITDMPVAVLVNGGSASASEIVAGALRDHRRGIVVGERTFGKASVQSVIKLSASEEVTAIRLTTAHYYTPSGSLIHEKGIEPDIPVPLTIESWSKVLMKRAQTENPGLYSDDEKAKYKDVVDTQLERAVDLLQAVSIFTAAEQTVRR